MAPNRWGLIEALADEVHRSWANWQNWVHSQGTRVPGQYSIGIPMEVVERWEKQIATPYIDLSEAEKDMDRAEVESRYLPVMVGFVERWLAGLGISNSLVSPSQLRDQWVKEMTPLLDSPRSVRSGPQSDEKRENGVMGAPIPQNDQKPSIPSVEMEEGEPDLVSSAEMLIASLSEFIWDLVDEIDKVGKLPEIRLDRDFGSPRGPVPGAWKDELTAEAEKAGFEWNIRRNAIDGDCEIALDRRVGGYDESVSFTGHDPEVVYRKALEYVRSVT